MSIKNIFISGPPGSGKSTLLMDIVKDLERHGYRIRGILCPEVRIHGRRWGFKVVVYPEGDEEILASIEIRRGPRVSKYGVNIVGFERVGVGALRVALEDPDVDIVIVDEIGKMELFSEGFRSVILSLLNSDKIIIGVLGRVRDPLVYSIKRRRDTKIFELSRGMDNASRSKLRKQIVKMVIDILEGAKLDDYLEGIPKKVTSHDISMS